MSARLPALLPPRAAMAISVAVVSVLVIVALVVGALLGLPAAIAAALGGITVVVMALMKGARWHAVAFGVVVGLLAAAATAAAGMPALVGILTAVSVVVSLPVVRRYGAVCGTAPVVVAVAGSDASSIGPGAALAGVAAAAVLVPIVLAMLGLARLEPTPLGSRRAGAYVAAFAAGSGLAIGVALALEVDHALWLVVALSAVLVPAHGETSARAGRRVVGTVVGTLVAAVLSSLVPAWIALAIAALLAVAGVGWNLAQHQTRGAGYVAAVLVLVAGAGASGEAWGVALQRIGLTVVGVVLAILLALALAWFERAEGGADPT